MDEIEAEDFRDGEELQELRGLPNADEYAAVFDALESLMDCLTALVASEAAVGDIPATRKVLDKLVVHYQAGWGLPLPYEWIEEALGLDLH